MRSKRNYFLFVFLLSISSLSAQIGIKIGMNRANQIPSSGKSNVTAGFNSNTLTGYQFGVVYQKLLIEKLGVGVELGALISQKGSSFHVDSTGTDGCTEVKYFEVPLNLRYRLPLGSLGIYAFGGVYAGYVLSENKVTETGNSTAIENKKFQDADDRMDYGCNLGAGVDLFQKIQLGGTWSQGLKNIENNNTSTAITNRVFSINLVYLF